jgi:acyl-CoA thioesterase
MPELALVLQVKDLGDGRYEAPNPTDDPEGRDIVFSGQILAQMIMASDAAAGGAKEVKSIHAIFARAGRYSAGPVELLHESMHAGRAWASDTITAVQGDRLLSRGLVLLNTVEPDLMRHAPAMPDVAGPDDSKAGPGVLFPGVEMRPVDWGAGGATGAAYWLRGPASYDSVAANQAVIAWSQPGFIIGLAMQPHHDTVSLADAHRTISTGVISHTAHFHDHADVGDWLLMTQEGTYAGNGRVFGRGAVFRRDGALVSTFAQDSMARRVEGELDPKSGM